jgi:hypothetical protein
MAIERLMFCQVDNSLVVGAMGNEPTLLELLHFGRRRRFGIARVHGS